MSQDHDDLVKKNARMGLGVLAFVILMVGVSFAAVPLYKLFCSVTGFGGTTQVAETLPSKVLEREVTILFNAQTAPTLNWNFKPDKRAVELKLGARGLTSFTAQNRASTPLTGTAIYNVTPPKAGQYFHKIQCFCFDEQKLQPRESMIMPVMFYIDPAMADDINMDDVETITLSYTFFPAESKELEQATEDFYDAE